MGYWTPGFWHEAGSYLNGFLHDDGMWLNGWNVYGLDENDDRVLLFFSDAAEADPEWTDYEAAREWQPDPGLCKMVCFVDTAFMPNLFQGFLHRIALPAVLSNDECPHPDSPRWST